MHSTITWFAKHRVAANLLMAILLVGGIYTVFTIKKEIQPRIETNFISIQVPFLGATPSDAEEGVVIKIEEAIQDIEGIEEIISTAGRGFGQGRQIGGQQAAPDQDGGLQKITTAGHRSPLVHQSAGGV